MDEITKKELIYAFTGHPGETARTPNKATLLQRLDIGLTRLREERAGQKSLPKATNVLQGALIRLSQAYGDPEVAAKVDELINLTVDISGI